MSIRRGVAAALCSLLPLLPGVLAGFDSGASNNIAIYWGMSTTTSHHDGTLLTTNRTKLHQPCRWPEAPRHVLRKQVNPLGQSLHPSTNTSADSPVNIIPLAFLTTIKNPTSVNFANAGDNCTVFPGTQLLRCPEIEYVALHPFPIPTSFPHPYPAPHII